MKKFKLVCLIFTSLFLINLSYATIHTANDIPVKVTGDMISSDDLNNIVGVMKGVEHDDKGTLDDYTDDRITVLGELCDNNGCLGDMTSGVWTSIADTNIDADTEPDGIYYGNSSRGDRIGIGTNDPLGILHLDRNNGEGPLTISKGSYGWVPGLEEDLVIGDGVSFWGINAGDDFKLGRASNSTHFYISNDGKVGIGETSPTANLHISDETGSATVKIDSASNQNSRLYFSENGTETWNIGNDTTADVFNIYNSVNGNTDFSINKTTGNIGINKIDATEKLEVNGNILVTTGNDICLSNGRCLSQNNGSGTTQHEGWPDAIKCDINNPDWGIASFYLTYSPVSPTYWGSDRNKFIYRLHHADRISVIFNPDKSFYGYQNISSTDCNNMTIPQLYDAGKAFNFLSMPVCNDQQTLKFNDGTNAWECADTNSTLPYCLQGQTLNFDAVNSQWICATNSNLPTCEEGQILQYNTTSTAWECTDGVDSVFPTCADSQILAYNAAMLKWECKNESGGSGTTLPTCTDGKIASYDDANGSWICDDKRPTCTDTQILTYNGTTSVWECTDNVASLPTCLNNQILTYNETDSAWECSNNTGGGGGASTDEKILALYKHTPQQLTGNYEPVDFDNQIRVDTAFSHSTSTNSSEVTIEEDGWYEITYHLSTDVDSGTSRSGSTAKIEINIGGLWGDLPGTLTYMYNRNDAVGGTSSSATIWHEFSTGDKIRLLVRQDSGSSTVSTLPDSVGLSVKKEDGGTMNITDNDWSINGNDLNTIVTGNVGIGVSSPVSKLDVNGGIKFGDDSGTCDASKAGTTRYNSTENYLELCNGTAWDEIGGGDEMGKIYVEEDNTNRTFGTNWADGMILQTRTIHDGWDIKLHYELPTRNDDTGWGGGYTEVQYSINSGAWHSVGRSGYQLAMGSNAKEIRTDTRTVYLQRSELTDAPATGDFDIQFKFRHRSYSGRLEINEDRGTSDAKFSSLFVIEEKKFEY
ncbi:hypothetical protein [Candidatus Harpocratesius sp.]